MNIPSYIATNLDELLEKTNPETQDLLASGEVDTVATSLREKYTIPEEYRIALSDVISFIIIGALQPEDVVQALQDLVNVTPENAIKIATELEQGILTKAGISLSNKSDTLITTLEFQGAKSKEELRKEILDTTKRESALTKPQVDDNSLDSKIALKSFMFGEKGKTIADSTINKITFSVPPTRYNVDPYREVDEV